MRTLIIPHAFQDHYTVGFTNAVTCGDASITLITSDRLPSTLFDPRVKCLNLIGNNDPRRSITRKVRDYIAYHVKLLMHIFMSRPDTIHVIGVFKYPILLGIFENLLLRLATRCLILTVHNILPHDKYSKLNARVHQMIYRIPHLLIVHTERMKRELVSSYGIAPERIIVMQHGANEIDTPPVARAEARAALALSGEQLVVLCFGNVAPYKGVDTLLEAFGMLNDSFYLVIAGYTRDTAYEQHLRRIIAENPNHDRIRYSNRYIDDSELPLYFGAADTIVLPYRHIDQSGVVFLAMRMGLPIIAFDVGSFRDYITGDVGIMAESNDAQGLKCAIERFRSEQQCYDREAIMQRAKNYDWSRVIAPVQALYVGGCIFR